MHILEYCIIHSKVMMQTYLYCWVGTYYSTYIYTVSVFTQKGSDPISFLDSVLGHRTVISRQCARGEGSIFCELGHWTGLLFIFGSARRGRASIFLTVCVWDRSSIFLTVRVWGQGFYFLDSVNVGVGLSIS